MGLLNQRRMDKGSITESKYPNDQLSMMKKFNYYLFFSISQSPDKKQYSSVERSWKRFRIPSK